jgi:hypothetical protein
MQRQDIHQAIMFARQIHECECCFDRAVNLRIKHVDCALTNALCNYEFLRALLRRKIIDTELCENYISELNIEKVPPDYRKLIIAWNMHAYDNIQELVDLIFNLLILI